MRVGAAFLFSTAAWAGAVLHHDPIDVSVTGMALPEIGISCGLDDGAGADPLSESGGLTGVKVFASGFCFVDPELPDIEGGYSGSMTATWNGTASGSLQGFSSLAFAFDYAADAGPAAFTGWWALIYLAGGPSLTFGETFDEPVSAFSTAGSGAAHFDALDLEFTAWGLALTIDFTGARPGDTLTFAIPDRSVHVGGGVARSAVPEPSSCVALGLALAAVLHFSRRKARELGA